LFVDFAPTIGLLALSYSSFNQMAHLELILFSFFSVIPLEIQQGLRSSSTRANFL